MCPERGLQNMCYYQFHTVVGRMARDAPMGIPAVFCKPCFGASQRRSSIADWLILSRHRQPDDGWVHNGGWAAWCQHVTYYSKLINYTSTCLNTHLVWHPCDMWEFYTVKTNGLIAIISVLTILQESVPPMSGAKHLIHLCMHSKCPATSFSTNFHILYYNMSKYS